MSAALTPTQEAARMVDSLGPAALAKAQAYTTASEANLVIGTLVAVLVAGVIVRLKLVDRIAARLANRGFVLRTFPTVASFFLLSALITLPWTIYAAWWHPRTYGLSRQPLGDFLGQTALYAVIYAVFGGLLFTGIYLLIRRTGRRWVLWTGALTCVGTAFLMLIQAVLIQPLFNEYKPLPPGEVRTAVEQIADDVGIPHDQIFMFDASRQSQMFNAYVFGVGPLARIAITDVALNGVTSLAEVRATTGHEAGHYKLGDLWRYAVIYPLLAMLIGLCASRFFAPVARLMGSDATLEEPRGLPVVVAIASVIILITSPLVNTASRIAERQADLYSLRTVNEPDALATVLLRAAEFRNPRPSAIEEVLFYTHPAIEKRVAMAMAWKRAHPKPAEAPVK